LQDAQRREGGGISGATVRHVRTDDVTSFDLNVVYVLGRDSYVLGDDVATAYSLDITAQGAKERFGIVGARAANDHALAPTQVEAAHGRLVGHPSCEAQGVGYGLALGVVGPHPAAAESRPKDGIVDRDDGP